MPVSPADFYAYSQATGVQVPDSPEERAQLAPRVLEFRRNQLKQPQEGGFDPVSMGVGIGLALAGAGAGALALRGRNKIPKATKTTGQSGVKIEDLNKITNVGKSKELIRQESDPAVERVAQQDPEVIKRATQDLGRFAESVEAPAATVTPSTGQASTLFDYERRSLPFPGSRERAREQFARSLEAPAATVTPSTGQTSTLREIDRADQLLNEYRQSIIDREIAREEKVKRDIDLMKEGAAMKIVDELRAEARDEAAQVILQNTLTDLQKRQEPVLSDQQINAVGSGEDQMTGRVRQQLQRNEDINLMEVDALEDINTQNINAMMEIGDPSQMMGYEADTPINQASVQTTGATPIDQAEGFIGPRTSQETLELAKQDILQRRQSLIEQGFQPGTTKFERALAQSFRTTANVQPRTTGPTIQKTTLPAGPIRQTVQEVSASQYLPEFTVENIGPEAKITKTALGTAIRGASPVLEQQPPVTRERQVFGTPDTNVPGAPDEMMPDRPARETALSQIEAQSQTRRDAYAMAQQEGGGPAGIGVYGIESSYVPGAQSKATGEYSAASMRRPTEIPFKEKQQGFQALNTEQLSNFIANAPEGRVRDAGIREQQRRANVQQSLAASEAIRRAKIEGRDPQSVLRSLGFGV